MAAPLRATVTRCCVPPASAKNKSFHSTPSFVVVKLFLLYTGDPDMGVCLQTPLSHLWNATAATGSEQAPKSPLPARAHFARRPSGQDSWHCGSFSANVYSPLAVFSAVESGVVSDARTAFLHGTQAPAPPVLQSSPLVSRWSLWPPCDSPVTLLLRSR